MLRRSRRHLPDGMRSKVVQCFASSSSRLGLCRLFQDYTRGSLMHSLSAARGPHIDSLFSRRVIGAIAALSMYGCLAAPAPAQDAASKANPPARAEFREPVTLASKDGVLEVRLTARQGTARLDTVATPVKNFFVFDYQLIRGT